MNSFMLLEKGKGVRYKKGDAGPQQRSARMADTSSNVVVPGSFGTTAAGHHSFNPQLRKERQLHDAVEVLRLYLQAERDGYYPQGEVLAGEPLKTMQGYFQAELLEK